MEWQEIMAMHDPHEALIEIEKKIKTENLSLREMENRAWEYAMLHEITVDEMAFYPNGERVIHP